MQLAIVAAGFTPGEADHLRRSMAAWKRKGGLEHLEQRLVSGMLARGYRREFAEQIYRQILGFGEYGFPESHSASFALLAYVSAWLKCHEPAAFVAALLNSQPMGFYAPAQLVQDARRHDVDAATLSTPAGSVRTERAQDFLMRQSRAADETIHFDGFREARRDMLGQLPEETAEQNLFVGRQHVQAQSAIHEQRTVPL